MKFHCLLLLCIVLVPAMAHGAEPSDYQGTYQLNDAAAAEAARDEAVEGVVALIPGLFRGLARTRLSRAATVTRFFQFEVEGDRMTIASDQSSGWATDLVATEIEATSTGGQKLHLSRWMDGGSLNSRARTRRGERLSLFALAQEGSRLTVTTTIQNPVLPKPLVYRTEYRRETAAEPSSP